MGIQRNDTVTLTVHFRTPNWTASSTPSRAGSPRSIGVPSLAAKNLVNQVSLPPSDRLLAAFTSFGTALTWPEAQHRIRAVLERGLQRDADFEKNWPETLGTLVEMEKKGASR